MASIKFTYSSDYIKSTLLIELKIFIKETNFA